MIGARVACTFTFYLGWDGGFYGFDTFIRVGGLQSKELRDSIDYSRYWYLFKKIDIYYYQIYIYRACIF